MYAESSEGSVSTMQDLRMDDVRVYPSTPWGNATKILFHLCDNSALMSRTTSRLMHIDDLQNQLSIQVSGCPRHR